MSTDQRIKGSRAVAKAQPVLRFARFKLAILLLVCALPATGVTVLLLSGVWLPMTIYLAMSVLAFLLYWHDKRQARASAWRTLEKVLHGVELLGGWPGALLAQQALRHKTRKVSFQLVFWLIVVLHEVVWADRLLLGGDYLARHFY